MTDVDSVGEIEMGYKFGEIVGISVEIVAVPRLVRPSMAAAVMGDAAIAARRQKKHLVFEGIRRTGQPWLKTIGWPSPQSL
jgi:hypothetical protein